MTNFPKLIATINTNKDSVKPVKMSRVKREAIVRHMVKLIDKAKKVRETNLDATRYGVV